MIDAQVARLGERCCAAVLPLQPRQHHLTQRVPAIHEEPPARAQRNGKPGERGLARRWMASVERAHTESEREVVGRLAGSQNKVLDSRLPQSDTPRCNLGGAAPLSLANGCR